MLINEFLILPLAFVFFNVSPASGDNYFTNNLSEKNNKINPVSIKYEEPASRGKKGKARFRFCYHPSSTPAEGGSVKFNWALYDNYDDSNLKYHGSDNVTYSSSHGVACSDTVHVYQINANGHITGNVSGRTFDIRFNGEGADNNWFVEQGCSLYSGGFNIERENSGGNSDNICTVKNYGDSKVIKINLSEMLTSNFKFAVIADPQAWRLESGDPNSESENGDEWRAINSALASDLNSRQNIEFGIINGDITEYGRDGTWNAVFKIYDSLYFQYYFGLGNHDYKNNVRDCYNGTTNSNQCAANSIGNMRNGLRRYVGYLNNLAYDWSTLDGKNANGSLSYSWDHKKVHFIQLQLNPFYAEHMGSNLDSFDYDIEKSIDWLEEDLKAARANGVKDIIINWHAKSLTYINGTSSNEVMRFRALMDEYKPLAIFVGHSHAFYFENNANDSSFGDVPVITTSAAFKGQYHLVDYNGNGILQITEVDSDGEALSTHTVSRK